MVAAELPNLWVYAAVSPALLEELCEAATPPRTPGGCSRSSGVSAATATARTAPPASNMPRISTSRRMWRNQLAISSAGSPAFWSSSLIAVEPAASNAASIIWFLPSGKW